jgi:hypothetical protein
LLLEKEGRDDVIPCILEPQGDEKTFRRNWAWLIQKIYEVDPLICPKCKGTMRIINSIEDPSVIRDILKHLGIWLVRSRPPPKIHAHRHYLDPNLLIITLSHIKTHTATPTLTIPGMHTYNHT